jgi:hypothetical protein
MARASARGWQIMIHVSAKPASSSLVGHRRSLCLSFFLSGFHNEKINEALPTKQKQWLVKRRTIARNEWPPGMHADERSRGGRNGNPSG